MYLRAERDWGLGRAAPDRRVIDYQCSTNAIVVDGFAVGDYRIPTRHFDKLTRLADDAEKHLKAGTPFSLSLTGHTDRSGEERMNRGLSLARAIEVQKWLAGAGLPVHNVTGKGETSPLDPANTAAAFRRNRRVEIRACLPKGTPPPAGLSGFSALHDQFLQCEPDLVIGD
jgi:outer membrane protein OmpA-like peptidoglycan-associated protein